MDSRPDTNVRGSRLTDETTRPGLGSPRSGPGPREKKEEETGVGRTVGRVGDFPAEPRTDTSTYRACGRGPVLEDLLVSGRA